LVDQRAVTIDGEGNVYILERRGNALRVVDKHGRIRTLIKPGDITPDLKGPTELQSHALLDHPNFAAVHDSSERSYLYPDKIRVTMSRWSSRVMARYRVRHPKIKPHYLRRRQLS